MGWEFEFGFAFASEGGDVNSQCFSGSLGKAKRLRSLPKAQGFVYIVLVWRLGREVNG